MGVELPVQYRDKRIVEINVQMASIRNNRTYFRGLSE